MQPIVHFLLSIVAGLGVGMHLENKIKKNSLILILAFACTSIDIDHIFPIYQNSGVKIFHNVFVFIIIPITLFLIFYFYEHKKNSSIGQRACILLAVMFVGHMFLDGTSGSMPFFYPLRPERYAIVNMGVTIDPSFFKLTSLELIMIIWGGFILSANLLETFIYNDVEGKVTSTLFSDEERISKKERKSILTTFFTQVAFINRRGITDKKF